MNSFEWATANNTAKENHIKNHISAIMHLSDY